LKSLPFNFTFTPRAGRIVPADPEALRSYLLANEGIEQQGTTKKISKRRSRGREDEKGNQDGFIFGTMIPIIADQIFFTKNQSEAYIRTLEETAYELKSNPRGGEPLKVLIHVSDMDMARAAQWIDDVIIWAASEHFVEIPDPDPTKRKRK